MAQSLSDIILHIVFSTKGRELLIQPSVEDELYKYVAGSCRNLESPVIKINGVADHIHILLQLGKKISACQLISEIKSNSSKWIKSKGECYENFAWQRGYGAFSVSRTNIETVIRYISSQKEHHKTISFQEEFLSMLQRAQISYDVRYLWE